MTEQKNVFSEEIEDLFEDPFADDTDLKASQPAPSMKPSKKNRCGKERSKL